MYGHVADSTSSESMISVNVSNATSGLLTSTNANGIFRIPVRKGDSLTLTYIGYKSANYIVFVDQISDTLEFQLTPQVTQLGEVEVNVFPEYWQFKQQIIDYQEIDSSLIVFGLNNIPLDAYPLEANEEKLSPPDYHAPGLKVGFDLGGLSRKGKEKKKVEKMLAQKEMERNAYKKFNREWVSKETQLTGDELTDFIAYCSFTLEYLTEASLFEIQERMMAILDDFKAERKQSRQRNNTPGA